MNGLPSTTRTFVAVLFLGLFALAARNVTDPDVWWHLRTGQYIAEYKSVPHTDPFSFTRGGAPWVAHEWLTDLLLYCTLRHIGWGGLILLFAAILCAAFFLLYLRCGSTPYVAGIATLVAAWATMPVWGVRPQVVSLLLTSLWLLILERSETNPRLLWWTVPLTLLWVNLHGGFAVGLALSALFIAGESLQFVLGYSSRSAPRMRKAAFVLLLDLLLVPLNPNGLRMFSYPIETLRSAAMQSYLAEWASPNFHHAEYWPFLFLILVAFAALAWSRRLVRPRETILLVASFYAGLVSIRVMPLFVLIAVPTISRRMGRPYSDRRDSDWPNSDWRNGDWPNKDSRRQRPQSVLHATFNAAIILGMVLFAGIQAANLIHFQPQAERNQFPERAVAFLQAHPVSGQIFNHYDWGGYLIWKLYPSTRVFIDGRADLYSGQYPRPSAEQGQRLGQLLDQFAHAYQFQGDWRRTLEQWNVNTVLVPPNSALATGLRSASGWTISYEDSEAIILRARP